MFLETLNSPREEADCADTKFWLWYWFYRGKIKWGFKTALSSNLNSVVMLKHNVHYYVAESCVRIFLYRHTRLKASCEHVSLKIILKSCQSRTAKPSTTSLSNVASLFVCLWGSCGLEGGAGRPQIAGLAVRFPAPPVYTFKYHLARHWTPKCLWRFRLHPVWLLAGISVSECVCINGWISSRIIVKCSG